MKTQRGDRKLRVEKEVKVYTSVYTKELTAAASRERKTQIAVLREYTVISCDSANTYQKTSV